MPLDCNRVPVSAEFQGSSAAVDLVLVYAAVAVVGGLLRGNPGLQQLGGADHGARHPAGPSGDDRLAL